MDMVQRPHEQIAVLGNVAIRYLTGLLSGHYLYHLSCTPGLRWNVRVVVGRLRLIRLYMVA